MRCARLPRLHATPSFAFPGKFPSLPLNTWIHTKTQIHTHTHTLCLVNGLTMRSTFKKLRLMYIYLQPHCLVDGGKLPAFRKAPKWHWGIPVIPCGWNLFKPEDVFASLLSISPQWLAQHKFSWRHPCVCVCNFTYINSYLYIQFRGW